MGRPGGRAVALRGHPDRADDAAVLPSERVDWVRDSSEAPLYRFTTFGRTPAVEVVIDNDKASGSALLDLSGAVSVIPQTSKCLNAEDVTGDGSTPAPTATPSENG